MKINNCEIIDGVLLCVGIMEQCKYFKQGKHFAPSSSCKLWCHYADEYGLCTSPKAIDAIEAKMNKSDSELKVKLEACPFCGDNDVKRAEYKDTHLIFCLGCFSSYSASSDIETAIKHWNTRPLEQQLQAENDELKKQVEGLQERRMRVKGGPSIPWSRILPHAAQCERNHGQTLERIAGRGGLSPYEAIRILQDKKIDFANIDENKAKDDLNDLISIWHQDRMKSKTNESGD